MLKKIILSVLVLLVIAAIGAWLWFRSTLPMLEGELEIAGLKEEVQVRYDDYGVPHIQAKNAEDAYMALGFVHAQDRLFQMEMLRRVASGRLSEVLGGKLLPVDKLFRTLGVNHAAEENARLLLSADTSDYQRAAHAYIRGLNAFISTGKAPIEFTLAGIPLTPFEDKDLFLVAGYMAFSFAEAMKVDPVIEKLQRRYPGYAEAAFGTPEENVRNTNRSRSWKDVQTADKIAAVISESLNRIPIPLLIGSNGWAISGRKTATGKPMLANDTHIGYAQPAVWYEASLEYPGFRFYGHHIAGIPFGVLGNNESIAWGITMFENDDMDFFQEEINPGNPMQIRRDSTWEDMAVRTETIRVKDSADVVLTVKSTRHGPVINGIHSEIGADEAPVSLWWSFLNQPATLINAFYDLNHAQDLTAARSAVSRINGPGLNIVYADTAGHIAWWAAARLPVRDQEKFGDSFRFLDGSQTRYDRVKWYPFEKNPQAIDPPWGYVHTGNNQPDTVDGIVYPGYYYPRDRAGRIEQLIRADDRWTAASVAQAQLDHISISAPGTARAMAELIPDAELAGILNGWDGNHDQNSVAPAVYYNLLSQIVHRAMGDEIGTGALKGLLATCMMRQQTEAFIRNDSTGWWDDVRTKERETRADILSASAKRTRELLEQHGGPESTDWTWGKIHHLKHNHPLGAVALLDRVFSVGPYPVSGGLEVVNNLMFSLDTTGVFPVTAGPALRKVHDLADATRSVTVSPSGQSGVLGSPHYDDQAKMFAEGKTRGMGVDGRRKTILKLVLAKP